MLGAIAPSFFLCYDGEKRKGVLTMLKDDKTIIDGVLAEFLETCKYPHGSRHEGPLIDYLQKRLESRDWPVLRDHLGNLRADIPATPGREKAPLVCIQGHMDMVCAVKPGSGYEPLTDPIRAQVVDGVLCTDGCSSLGADNNLGNAAVLYLLDQKVPHGPLRLIFTMSEELGLLGVTELSREWLDGVQYLINTDGFKLGRAVVSSAGGLRQCYEKEISFTDNLRNLAFFVRVGTSTGGHSGYDINKGRANCIKLLALFLHQLGADWELCSFSGGHALNAIPLDAGAVIALEDAEGMEERVAEFNRKIRSLYAVTDPRVALTVEAVPAPERVWSRESRDSLLDFLLLLTDGTVAMHRTMPELVAASCNLGAVREREDGRVEVDSFMRFANAFYEDMMVSRHDRAARLLGFACSLHGYPCWEGDASNPLAQKMSGIYRELTGEEMELTAVHVGLEPSLLGVKNPEMVMVVTGPEILDPHSVDERAPIAGLGTYVRLLARTLEEI